MEITGADMYRLTVGCIGPSVSRILSSRSDVRKGGDAISPASSASIRLLSESTARARCGVPVDGAAAAVAAHRGTQCGKSKQSSAFGSTSGRAEYGPVTCIAMRLAVLNEFGEGGPILSNRADPQPGPGQVLLAMRAASLNYRDWLVVTGKYNPKFRLPLIPGSDGVGEVIAVGSGVNRVRVGDRVCPIFAQGWLTGDPERRTLESSLGGPLDGTLAERMVVPESAVVAAPRHLSDREAACLPCAAVTAWRALVTLGHVSPGDVVLTQGTGGVSSFALQFAKLAGARVIATSKSDAKLARATELGADAIVNYARDVHWGDAVRKLTDGRGVDHVVDVGGAATLAQSLRAVRVGGTISLIGNLADAGEHPTLLPAVMRQVRLQGVLVGSRSDFEQMNRAIEHGRLRPVVDRAFDLGSVGRAFAHLVSGTHVGKVVVDLS